MTFEHALTLISLAIALLAVFFGPLISTKIAKRQIESSEKIALKQVVAPMRQAWINGLRDKVSRLCAEAEYCCYNQVAGSGVSSEYKEQARELHRLEKEIALTINPSEEDHKHLVRNIRDMLLCVSTKDVRGLQTALQKTMELTQKILKTEWNRVKSEL